jgi:hypothetical protein
MHSYIYYIDVVNHLLLLLTMNITVIELVVHCTKRLTRQSLITTSEVEEDYLYLLAFFSKQKLLYPMKQLNKFRIVT